MSEFFRKKFKHIRLWFNCEKILNQTNLFIKKAKTQEIVSNMRKNELIIKLNLIGIENERIKRKA